MTLIWLKKFRDFRLFYFCFKPGCRLTTTFSNLLVLFLAPLAIDSLVIFGELRQFLSDGLPYLYLGLSCPCLPCVWVYSCTESTNFAYSLSLSRVELRTRIGWLFGSGYSDYASSPGPNVPFLLSCELTESIETSVPIGLTDA